LSIRVNALSVPLFLYYHPNGIWCVGQSIKTLVMYPATLILLRLNILLSTNLDYPQAMFVLQNEKPSFTSIQNNRQNYSSVYFNFIFLIEKWEKRLRTER
jgi:hypothetical protein